MTKAFGARVLFEDATLQAYAECFRVMVLASVAAMPGVVLFRIRPAAVAVEQLVEQAAEQSPSPLLRAD